MPYFSTAFTTWEASAPVKTGGRPRPRFCMVPPSVCQQRHRPHGQEVSAAEVSGFDLVGLVHGQGDGQAADVAAQLDAPVGAQGLVAGRFEGHLFGQDAVQAQEQEQVAQAPRPLAAISPAQAVEAGGAVGADHEDALVGNALGAVAPALDAEDVPQLGALGEHRAGLAGRSLLAAVAVHRKSPEWWWFPYNMPGTPEAGAFRNLLIIPERPGPIRRRAAPGPGPGRTGSRPGARSAPGWPGTRPGRWPAWRPPPGPPGGPRRPAPGRWPGRSTPPAPAASSRSGPGSCGTPQAPGPGSSARRWWRCPGGRHRGAPRSGWPPPASAPARCGGSAPWRSGR